MHRRTTPEQWLDWVEDHEKLMDALKAEKKEVREIWYEDLINGNLDPMQKILVRELVRNIAAISDRAENAGDLIRIIVAKRKT